MGVFKRIADIVTANVNDLIDKAEDPEKMAKQIIREMEESIGEVRAQVAQAMAAEHQLSAQLSAAKAEAEDWERRAIRAVELDRDDLARQALLKRRDAERVVRGAEPQLVKAREATELLREQLRVLEDRIMFARRKRDTIIARQRMAEASSKVSRTVGRFSKAADHLSRMSGIEDRVDAMEARMTAEMTLLSESTPLEEQFEKLEEEHTVDAELAALKERLRGRLSGGGDVEKNQ